MHNVSGIVQTDRADTELNTAPKYFEDYQAGRLHINELAVTDEATYQCKAINRVGDDSRSLLVRVFGSILSSTRSLTRYSFVHIQLWVTVPSATDVLMYISTEAHV